MELVELEPLANSIVGKPGISGLSVEQRKRLTIAVELVANPSIIFMVSALLHPHMLTHVSASREGCLRVTCGMCTACTAVCNPWWQEDVRPPVKQCITTALEQCRY